MITSHNKEETAVKPKKHLIKSVQKSVKKTKRLTRRKVKKHFHTLVPGAVFVLVAAILLSANQFNSSHTSRDTLSTRLFGKDSEISVDEVISTNLARIIANDADIIVAGNINNLASTVEARITLNISEQAYVAKPQIVTTDAKTSKDILTYTVKEGDTISSISKQFGITSDTIRWSNDISGDLVSAGRELKILPVDGLLYEIKSGDTAAKLAKTYSADAEEIITFNDAEIDGLTEGSSIIIPGGKKPAPAPVRYFSTATVSTGFSYGSEAIYAGNRYVWGNCTWHVSNRRFQIGRPIPSNLGNAISWASRAPAAGMVVNSTPKYGAIIYHVNDPWSPYYGHVGFVERVNPDGSILVSDMNYNWQLGVVSERTVPPAEFGKYLFIH